MAMMNRPTSTTRFVPQRNTRRGAIGEPTIMPIASGVVRMPASSGRVPQGELEVLRRAGTCSRTSRTSRTSRWRRRRRSGGSRRSAGRASGSPSAAPRRRTATRTPPRIRAPRARSARAIPRSGASMIAKSSPIMATMESNEPNPSSGVSAGSRESGTNHHAAVNTTTQTGTFTRKTAPHQKFSTKKPPTRGPTATPDARDACPDPDGSGTLAPAEHVGEDGQRRREDERGRRCP